MTDYYTPSTEEVRELYIAERVDYRDRDSIHEQEEQAHVEFELFRARLRAEGAAEALAVASTIRAEMGLDELAMHDLSHEEQLPLNSRIMLNGATRFAERLAARQSVTPVPEETRTVLMTEPHNGHEPSALCPGCPHEAVPEEGRTNNVFPNDCLY
jgi:TPP-dependent indolepyruvate ferredoxin oxidoreductase alpha subunit